MAKKITQRYRRKTRSTIKTMNEDNQGAIELSKNPRFHNRTKHIDVAYHFVREKVNDKSINVKY